MNTLAPDLILTNANLITLDPLRPRATAMAIRDGRIVSVGSDSDILPLAVSRTQTLDLKRKTLTPGFCDSHIHLLWYGMQLLKMSDLVGVTTIDEILSRLSSLATRSHEGWLQGHGFDQDKLREKRFPTRQDLDRISTTRPILISRICGHAVIVNSAALALVTADERKKGDPDSGLYTE